MAGPEPGVPTAPAEDIVDTAAAGPAAMRGGFIATASLASGMVLALASTPLLIRHLGDAEFGRYTTVLAVVTIVGGLVDGGITMIALRELAVLRERRERDRLLSDLLALRLVLGAVGIAGAVAFSAVAGYGDTLVLGTLLAGLGIVLSSTQSLVAAVLHSRLRFGWAALVELARQLLGTVLVIVLVLAGASILWFLVVPIPAGIVALVLTIVLVRELATLRPTWHPRRWMPLLRDTIVFAVAIAVNTLYFRVTLVIMSLVASAAATGYFAISYRIIEVFVAVPGLLLGAAYPIVSRAAHRDSDRFQYVSERMFELSLLLGALLSLLLILGAPFAIEVLVGRADHPSTGVLQIQSAAVLASFVAAGTGYPLLSKRLHRETLFANCVSLVLAVVLALTLAPAYGARGAAVAAIAADFALAATNTTLLVRRGGVRLPLSAVAVALGAAVAGFGAARLTGAHPVVEAAVGGAAYLLVVVALRRFPPEVRDIVRRQAVPGRA